MNEYGIGAMEALSWAKEVLKECRTPEEFRKAYTEIDATIGKLMTGAAINFQKKMDQI